MDALIADFIEPGAEARLGLLGVRKRASYKEAPREVFHTGLDLASVLRMVRQRRFDDEAEETRELAVAFLDRQRVAVCTSPTSYPANRSNPVAHPPPPRRARR